MPMTDTLDDATLPPPLRDSLARHRRHLAELVDSLRQAGMDDRAIEAGVARLIASYRAELMAALHMMETVGG